MEISKALDSMDEHTLRNIANKLVALKIIKSFLIVDRRELCYKYSNYPNIIFQNTKSRFDADLKDGHWVCYFVHECQNRVDSLFYDPLGKHQTSYNTCMPPNCKTISLTQHQSNSSKLCSLFCLFFVISYSLDRNIVHTFNKMLNLDQTIINDQLMVELYDIITKSNTTSEFVSKFKALKNAWCKYCGLIFCNCNN